MITKQRRRSILSRLWMPLITAAFLGYFGYHAFSGYYGIVSRERLERDAVALSQELEELKEKRAWYENRVAILRSDHLDADLVDVAARRALNRVRSDEVVLRFAATQK
jgi:cell division protein FtsB